MFYERTAVGLDVHSRSVVAHAVDWETGEVFRSRLVPQHPEILRWVQQLPGPAAVAYEAGPHGFGLARALEEARVRCVVVAPSKVERPPGDKVKTDKRDALRLARLLHIGELPAVRVPAEWEETARDLVRARDDVRTDLMRARHRLAKLLLRHGYQHDGQAWTMDHERWLRSLRFEDAALRTAFREELDCVLATLARRNRMDAALEELAERPEWRPTVRRVSCIRGVGVLTAVGLTTEVSDWTRFTGSTIGSFLGLVPSENSSGSRRVQGPITKTGNTHARRLLVEAAWQQRRPLHSVGTPLRKRRDLVCPAVRARAQLADRRLHHRWVQMDARGKRSTVTAVAIARELAGWCWSLAVMDG
ncbi:IS110 family transposase [Streptomyces sp. CRN 30]|uniref:IS110 family transposase n=1 Tax=Streptomyces sp. CRN 30 TaxID=3075613 RepID=UPI002A7F491C|nr:IS110 family transposase [Streptomyces sp. CRN 30]